MKKFFNKKLLGIVISLVFIAGILIQVDLDKTIKAFSLINPLMLLPVIPIYLSSFTVRAIRWKLFLNKKNLGFNSLISSIFLGFSLNCLLPARAGELYRAYFFSKKESLNKTEVFTSVVLERFFDGFVLFIILLAAIFTVHKSELLFKIALLAGLTFLSGMTGILLLAKFQQNGSKREWIKSFALKISRHNSFVNKIFSIINSFFDAIKTLKSYKTLLGVFALTFVIWALEGTTMYFIVKSFGINMFYTGAYLVLTVTAFSSLIPAGPAGIGPYQWGYILALSAFNIPTELALAVSVTNQFILISLILSAGFYYIWKDELNINTKELNDDLNWG